MLGFECTELHFEFLSFFGFGFTLGVDGGTGCFLVIVKQLGELLNTLIAKNELCLQCRDFL